MPASSADRPSPEALFPVTTDAQEETQSLGATLAARLPPGSVVGLYGNLGTGKTHLVKGIAEGLGLPPAQIRSPTFTILHSYEEGDTPLHHFDAYRVQTPDEFVELGFEEYVSADDSITCIEWADRVESVLPDTTLRLTLTHEGPHRRRFVLGAPPSDAA